MSRAMWPNNTDKRCLLMSNITYISNYEVRVVEKCLGLSVFQLCFASLLSAPTFSLRNFIASLFLRVLHSFAENVLAFASTHEVGFVTVPAVALLLCIMGMDWLSLVLG